MQGFMQGAHCVEKSLRIDVSITSLTVPCDNCLRMRSTVVTGKYLSHIFVCVFLREKRTVDRGRVAASLCVHEEFGVADVPRHRAQRLRHELLVLEPGVVDFDLMATERGRSATYGDSNDIIDYIRTAFGLNVMERERD